MKYILVVLVLLSSGLASADWSPPKSPDPRDILNQARSDARSGNYKEALKKHIWFHNNSLKYRESLYGVRLSFALSDWHELGKKYPLALHALQAEADKSESDVRKGNNFYASFHDFVSINETLGRNKKTVALFIWLDKVNPEQARKVYRLVDRMFFNEGEYVLAGKYLDPQNSYLREVRNFHDMKEYRSRYPNIPDRMKNFAYRNFAENVTRLVALLVLNNRKAEAEDIAGQALLEWNDVDFEKKLNHSLKGEFE